jgi:hypothetical protein
LVLAVELTGAKSERHRDGMDGYRGQEFSKEILPHRFLLWGDGTGRAVRQLNQSNNRNPTSVSPILPAITVSIWRAFLP